MNPPPKPPPGSKPKLALPKAPPASKPASGHTPKTFSVVDWTGSNEGEKIILYAPSGMGKTTLASMAPNPIFLGVDDGGRKIRNPKTGAPVKAVPGIETFHDIRDVLHQYDLFPEGSTVVLDTITKAEAMAEPYVFATVKKESGQTAHNIEDYGYGKGYRHLLDAMRLLISDFDPLVRRGVNVILLAQQGQATVANLEGTDYLEDGPKLSNAKNYSTRTEVCEWADHVFRIGHADITVVKANSKATKGKVSGTAERVIYTTKELHFLAKNRMNGALPPTVAFTEPADDSLWKFVFEGAREAV
jgi:hypothetical protein